MNMFSIASSILSYGFEVIAHYCGVSSRFYRQLIRTAIQGESDPIQATPLEAYHDLKVL